MPSLRVSFRMLLLVGASPWLLAGCCWDVFSENSTSVTFRFSADTLGTGSGFRREELRSAYLVRYLDADLTLPGDTLRQPAPGTPPTVSTSYFQILAVPVNSFGLYFQKSGSAVYPGSFRVVVPTSQRSFDIRQPDLELAEHDDRCGGQYVRRVRFTLNGELIDREPTTTPIVLSK
ncbi:hypothetical protein DNI29_13185 [Hymenobacter sediminis]|uniref:hypothetical protein n=1 Tax=Hymenobacter sediminis TaxID=2218621 RepID=UPI000F4F6F61|nr:hypothetical protein [Hymenobacter sediminis]RPD47099.1 hypothetical protein DNI29_13185 [Hymenobacter sediminis]